MPGALVLLQPESGEKDPVADITGLAQAVVDDFDVSYALPPISEADPALLTFQRVRGALRGQVLPNGWVEMRLRSPEKVKSKRKIEGMTRNIFLKYLYHTG